MMVSFALHTRSMSNQRAALQNAADIAALNLVREQSVVSQERTSLSELAATFVDNTLKGSPNYLREPRDVKARRVSTNEKASGRANVIEVSITQLPVENFESVFGFPERKPITVNARALQVGGSNICVIALDPSKKESLYLDSNAKLTAPNCAIYSNSSNASGLTSKSNAVLTAQRIFSHGGFAGGARNFSPEPVTDYPALEDPLASRAAPTDGPCDYHEVEIEEDNARLRPGTYCGGLEIEDDAVVELDPGIYVIRDGALTVDSNATLIGRDVGFYLKGKGAVFSFTSNAVIDISAPTTGEMAGILFFEDRAASTNNEHLITSNNARYMVGTIYLSRGKLRIDADMAVADESEYTAIVARQIELNSGPNLVLNTDYELTDVPVPQGLGPQDGASRLIE